MKSPIYPHLILLSVTLIFGVNYIVAKNVLDPGHIFPSGFILLRISFAVIFFWILHAIFFHEKVEKRDIPRLAICGLFGIAINQLFFFKGLKLTSAMNASLIIMVVPLLVIIFSAVLIREKVTINKILGVLLGGIGAVIILTSNKGVTSGDAGLLGDLFILLNACSFAIYLVLVKTLMQKYSAFTVIKWVFSFGMLYVLPFGFGELKAVEWSGLSSSVLWSIAYVLLFATVYAYTMNIYSLKFVTPSAAASYIYVQPFVASTLSIMLGREEFSVVKLGAAILIFLGVYFVSKMDQNPKSSKY